jgi:hypothetical protein
MKSPACLLCSVGTVLVAASCTPVDGPAPALTVALTNIVPNSANLTVGFDYSITNTGSAAAYIPACAGVPRPSVAIDGPGSAHDEAGGALCIAILDMSPVRLAPGEGYAGHDAVAQRAGVRYTVFVTYTPQPSGGETRSAAAPAFSAP